MPVTVIYTPPPGPQTAIADALASARIAIRCLLYELSNPTLVQALIDAHHRGVSVSVVLDAKMSREKTCLGKELVAAGISVSLDAQHQCMHHKSCIIDGALLYCGSYNWSYAAEHENAECSVRIDDPPTVAQAAMQFGTHLSHSGAWLP